MTSKIEIVNKNKKSLKIHIKPEGNAIGRVFWKIVGETITGILDEVIGSENSANYFEDIVLDIPADANLKYSINFADAKGIDYFSIKGDTSVFTPGSECKNLCTTKNYRITFSDDTIGTTCKAVEI